MRERLLAALLRLAGGGRAPRPAWAPGRIAVVSIGAATVGMAVLAGVVLIWRSSPWLVTVVCDYLGIPPPI